MVGKLSVVDEESIEGVTGGAFVMAVGISIVVRSDGDFVDITGLGGKGESKVWIVYQGINLRQDEVVLYLVRIWYCPGGSSLLRKLSIIRP
jgi:hypothetical protein